MKLLLDTHAFLWWDTNDDRLPVSLRSAIASPRNEVFVSAVTVWEIAIKVRIGKMNADPTRLVKLLDSAGFRELAVFSRHAVLVTDLPLHHADPFDRLLVVQAISESLILLTADTRLIQYGSNILLV